MRLSSLVTLACCIGALVLTFLLLFAGSSRTFLQNGEILTVNMSRLGYVGDVLNTTDGDGGFLDNLINSAEDSINDLINDATTDIASALNISDYYNVHVMNYCRGMYEPNGTAASEGMDVSENTTYCSRRNALFHFNVTEIVESVLPLDITLRDISWPDAITDAQKLIRTVSIATVVLYILGIAFTGLALIGALFGVFTSGRLSACLNVVLDFLAFLTVAIASILATLVMVKAVDALNQYGGDIGISATRGDLFLGMTWAATGLLLIAVIVSIVQLIRGRKNKGYISEMKEDRHSRY